MRGHSSILAGGYGRPKRLSQPPEKSDMCNSGTPSATDYNTTCVIPGCRHLMVFSRTVPWRMGTLKAVREGKGGQT